MFETHHAEESKGDWNRTNAWTGKADSALCTGPKAAVFNLRTFEGRTIPPPWETGQAARRLIFDLIGTVAPDVADSLHEAIQMKPYTSSFFYTEEGNGEVVWRVTDLMGHLLPLIHQAVFKRSGPMMVDLCSVPAKFEGVAVSESHHPGAGAATWHELRNAPGCDEFEVGFESPTAFRTGGRVFNLFPNPLSVLQSAASKWAVFSGSDDFPNTMIRSMASQIEIKHVNLRTHKTRGVKGLYHHGAVGMVAYKLLVKDPKWLRAFSVLMPFLRWAGVGWGTGAGMGQVVVERRERREGR